MTEVRYWKRMGFAVTEDQALEMLDRIADSATGTALDGDIEEFEQHGGNVSKNTLKREIKDMFSRDFDPELDTVVDNEIDWIVTAITFERSRKQFIKDKKAEGMTLEEAKEAYDFEKANIVRNALDLPPVEEITAIVEENKKPRDGRGNRLSDEEILDRQREIEINKTEAIKEQLREEIRAEMEARAEEEE